MNLYETQELDPVEIASAVFRVCYQQMYKLEAIPLYKRGPEWDAAHHMAQFNVIQSGNLLKEHGKDDMYLVNLVLDVLVNGEVA